MTALEGALAVKDDTTNPKRLSEQEGVDCSNYNTTTKFGHFPPPQKKHLPGGQLPPPFFFFFFWRTFLGFFDLQLMEDIKDGKEEVLDEVVMEHIK